MSTKKHHHHHHHHHRHHHQHRHVPSHRHIIKPARSRDGSIRSVVAEGAPQYGFSRASASPGAGQKAGRGTGATVGLG